MPIGSAIASATKSRPERSRARCGQRRGGGSVRRGRAGRRRRGRTVSFLHEGAGSVVRSRPRGRPSSPERVPTARSAADRRWSRTGTGRRRCARRADTSVRRRARRADHDEEEECDERPAVATQASPGRPPRAAWTCVAARCPRGAHPVSEPIVRVIAKGACDNLLRGFARSGCRASGNGGRRARSCRPRSGRARRCRQRTRAVEP